VVRIFNTFGENMQKDDGRVVSNFIVQALKGENLTIYGKGNQSRSFCYIADLLNGLLKTMEINYEQPLNLGNPVEFKVIELARLILKLTASQSKIDFLPLPEDDPKRRKPDIAKAKKLLNWQPLTSLGDGLKRTIEYFKRVI
jgi:nucleoside-diphosphate-sugar epimerase